MQRLQTLEFRSGVGTWRLWIWPPAEDLATAVANLWATEAYTVSFREKIVPRETVELMINFGGTQALHHAEGMRGAWAGVLDAMREKLA